MEKIKLISVITCPFCGYSKEEKMPVDSCVHFYECTRCKAIIQPKEGDCCVFCSYGDVKCPTKQIEENYIQARKEDGGQI